MIRRIFPDLFHDKFQKETFWSFAAKGSSFLLFLVLNIILARFLGVCGFGEWSFFLSVLTVLLYLSYCGINASSQKFVAQYNHTPTMRSVFVASFHLRVVVSLAFALLLLILHIPLASALGRPELAFVFLSAVPLLFLAGIVEYLKNVFEGLHRIKYNFIVNLLEYGLKLIFITGVLFLSTGLVPIIGAFTLALLIASLAGGYLLYTRFYLTASVSPHGCGGMTWTILCYSAPLFIITIGMIIATEIDTIMIGLLSTDVEVGLYAAAKNIIVKIPHISYALAMGTMPIFAQNLTLNREMYRDRLDRLLRKNAFIILPIIGGILLFSGYFISFIYGSGYEGSVLPFQILTLYLLCVSFSIPLGQLLDYQGQATKRAFFMVMMILFNIILNFLLIPIYGAVGAAIGTSLSLVPYLLLTWLEVRRVLYR